jgi:hypothetical protein
MLAYYHMNILISLRQFDRTISKGSHPFEFKIFHQEKMGGGVHLIMCQK